MASQRPINYALKPTKINAAKPREKPYPLTDGGGLFVEVMPGGSKVWRFKYHRDGKREKVTIGPYPSFGIKEARDRHEVLRSQLHHGDSPAKAKQRAAIERRDAAAKAVTFRAFAKAWIDQTLFYRSPAYRAQTARWLDAHIYPAIGDRILDQVRPADVLAILERLMPTPTTAERVRVIIQQIYNFAIRKLVVSTNPATPLKGAVSVPPAKHHRHLSERELGAFWRALNQQAAHATTVFGAQLLMLTMVRKTELRCARWSEFDLEISQWDIPAARMKMRRPHRVFLSRQAVDLLWMCRRMTYVEGVDAYVFPSIFKRSVPMAGETFNHLFKRLDFGVPDFSPHGTRGTAATLLREAGFGRDVVELLLAHAEKNETVAAYSHIELADERRRAMQFLADRIDQLAAGAKA